MNQSIDNQNSLSGEMSSQGTLHTDVETSSSVIEQEIATQDSIHADVETSSSVIEQGITTQDSIHADVETSSSVIEQGITTQDSIHADIDTSNSIIEQDIATEETIHSDITTSNLEETVQHESSVGGLSGGIESEGTLSEGVVCEESGLNTQTEIEIENNTLSGGIQTEDSIDGLSMSMSRAAPAMFSAVGNLSTSTTTSSGNMESSIVTESSEDVIPEYFYEILDNIARENGLNTYKNQITKRKNYGDGFFSIVYDVIIKGSEINLTLVAKLLPTSIPTKHRDSAMALFKREVFVYKKILPELVKFQKDYLTTSSNKKEQFNGFPKCYYANVDESKHQAVIVLENPINQNCNMLDKIKIPDFEHIRRVFIELGKFHSLSLGMKHLCPDEFEKLKEINSIGDDQSPFKINPIVLQAGIDYAIETLRSNESFKIENMMKLKENVDTILNDCINSENAKPGVITHGDCWINNIFFHYKQVVPENISFIGWEMSRYGSPILDLIYFLFTSTNKKFRDEHYDNLIHIYYKSLRDNLERMGLDGNNVIPYPNLLRQLKKFGRYGLILSCFIVPVMYIPNEELENLNKNPNLADFIALMKKHETKEQKQRIAEIIGDAQRLGFF